MQSKRLIYIIFYVNVLVKMFEKSTLSISLTHAFHFLQHIFLGILHKHTCYFFLLVFSSYFFFAWVYDILGKRQLTEKRQK